jgi:hypothetical protein
LHRERAPFVSYAQFGALYVEWGDGVLIHFGRWVGVRFKFRVWRLS